VAVEDHAGKPVGVGYANPHSLIAVRLLCGPGEEVGPKLITDRIFRARALRERLCPGREAYRAVYSESDLLPGLVVDRYGTWLSVQVTTAGMERLLPVVLDGLREAYRPDGIVLRNDSKLRELEGLPLTKRVVEGDYKGAVAVDISGIRFMVDMMEGQKTGFFLDQVDNYHMLDQIAKGSEMLDMFCHTGAWALYAAKAGAASVTGVDSSASALKAAAENARANGFDGGLEGGVSFIEGDAFDALKRLDSAGRKFDVVVVDPPAFIKNRSKIAEGLKGYRDVNVRAMRVVKPGGYLVSCSCSHHLEREAFRDMLRSAASGAVRTARLIEMRSQSKDHPALLGAPETEYLKCALVQVL